MPSDLESGSQAKVVAPKVPSPKTKNLDDLQITVKVNYEDVVKRQKMKLRDVGAASLERKIREFLEIPNDDELLLERYSDSAGAYITLDDQNQAVYKQLYRAAKAKQKLKLRATKKSALLQSAHSLPKPASVEDVPEVKPAAPEPEPTAAPAVPAAAAPSLAPAVSASTTSFEPFEFSAESKRSTIHDVLRGAEPRASLPASSAALPATDTGFDFETSLLTSLMGRHNLGGEAFSCTPKPQQPEQAKAKEVQTLSGSDARDDWFTRASTGSVSSGLCPRRAPGSVSYAVCCNSCDKNIPDAHYHCSTCDDGDFDLCQGCVDKGISCYNEDHWLIKRALRDGQIVTSTTETIAPKPKKQEQKKVAEVKPAPKPVQEPKKQPESIISAFTYSARTCNCCVSDLPEHHFLHCTVCEDFDLCQACFAKDNHGHTPKHAFVPAVAGAYVPNHIKIRLAPGRNQMHNAICDGCDKHITGVRHKCLDCPDWDYCSDCVPTARNTHPGHRFAPLYEPLEEARGRSSGPFQQTHFGICCDGPMCKTSNYIRGVRYKCTICHDTDFCASCEASPANTHNKTHPLIKFRTPVRHCTVATHAERGDGHALPQMGDRSQQPEASPRRADKTAIASVQTVVDMKPTEPTPVKEEAVEEKPVPVVVAPKALVAEKDLNAVFVRDTVADGSVLPPSHAFEQTWYLRNDGDVAWPAGCAVKFVGGDYMGHLDPNQPAGISELVSSSESITCYEALAPGKEFAFTVLLRTPAREGKAISYWRLTTKDGMKFGHRLWCDVKVEAAPEPAEAAVSVEQIEDVSKEAEEAPEIQGSQMIFPKLEKESPMASIHQDAPESHYAKSEATSSPTLDDGMAEVDDFDDCGDAQWDGSDDGFMTDEEYDILDASDEEYLEEQQRRLRK